MAKKQKPKGKTVADKKKSEIRKTVDRVSVKKKTPANKKDVTAGSDQQDFFIFKDGLYYPFIDIHDEAWLKSAALYWDSISTLVPDGFGESRTNKTSRYFAEAEFLKPEFVSPGMVELDQTADDCIEFLDSPEGLNLIAQSSRPRDLGPDHSNWHPEAINHNKLTRRILDELRLRGIPFEGHGRWIRLPGWFARYYMTVLAARFSKSRGQSLLTNDVAAEPLANKGARGDTSRQVASDVSQGILATMILQTLHISDSTSPQKILKFKEKHGPELGLFRSAVRELIQPISGRTDVRVLQKHLSTIHTDKVLPSIEQLRGRLKDNRIACGFNNLRASTLLSASPTALGVAMSNWGSVGPFALLGGIGISILLSAGNYNLQKRDLLRSSPYSYVLRAEEQFGKRKK